MAKLNPNAQKWVEALRSGKYKQGKDVLRHMDRFCCLGVLCEVAIENGVRLAKEDGPNANSPFRYDGDDVYLPSAAQQWVGINSPQGSFSGTTLANKNDTGSDFSEISILIEENAEELGLCEKTA